MYKMKHLPLLYLTSFVPFLSIQAEEVFSYLGSYTFVRATDSGHVYVSEFRLWLHNDAIIGFYLHQAGLGGDPVTMIHKITKGDLKEDNAVKLRSRLIRFTGTLTDRNMEGILKLGSETVRGGIEGSNTMILKKGTTIKQFPERTFKAFSTWQAWADSLRYVQ